jgi:hypothetical protein
MRHQRFRNQLPTFTSPWLTDPAEHNAALARARFLGLDNSILARVGQPTIGDWDCVFSVDGDGPGSGTFFLPKFWRDQPTWAEDENAISILKGYPCLFEFFRFHTSQYLKLSLRAQMDHPYNGLKDLCEKLRTPRPLPKDAHDTRSPAAWKSQYEKPMNGFKKFKIDAYQPMQTWLERLIVKGEFDEFKQLVFLAPAFF